MGRSKSDAKKPAQKNKGIIAQAHTIAEKAKAKATKKRRHSDSDDGDELDKAGTDTDSEVAATTESSSDDGVVQEELVGKSKKLKTAQDTIKHLNASIAAQEATNEKRLAELAQTRNSYQSEVEVTVTELYFRNICSEIQFQYSLQAMY